MRARAGFLGGLFVLLIGAGVAWLAYQAGLSQAAATAVATGTAAPVVVYGAGWGAGWGAGFGFFHIFGLLFGLFLLFGVARLFFGLLFWRGPRHWAEGRPNGPFGPGMHGPWGRRAGHLAELHRELHEEEARRAAEPKQQ